MSMDVHVIDDVCMVFGKGIKILKWGRWGRCCNAYVQKAREGTYGRDEKGVYKRIIYVCRRQNKSL